MGTGYLTIQTRTQNEAIPISGARVRVRSAGGRVLYNLVTDEEGQTRQVPLEAVDRDLSLDPEFTGTPYTTYELDVEADGYNTIHITGVQIFDGEHSYQPVTMLPLLESQRGPVRQEIDIEENALLMPVERNQVGPVISPAILRLVIIPNLITVHLGAPTASAQNVQVRFTDYIKNMIYTKHQIR